MASVSIQLGAIIGGSVVGGIVLVALIVVAFVCVWRRKNYNSKGSVELYRAPDDDVHNRDVIVYDRCVPEKSTNDYEVGCVASHSATAAPFSEYSNAAFNGDDNCTVREGI
jgi:hypothetical protein